ncbi:protein kilB [Streptomyces bacillaris]
MVASIVSAAAALLGVALTLFFQQRQARQVRAEGLAGELRRDTLQAVAELAAAVADHRRAMWVREEKRLNGEDWAEARAASHTTRSAITIPYTRLCILAPALDRAANDALAATYAMRNATTLAELEDQRDLAFVAQARLMAAATTALNPN